MRVLVVCSMMIGLAFSIIVQAKKNQTRKSASAPISNPYVETKISEILSATTASQKIEIFKVLYTHVKSESKRLEDEIIKLLDAKDNASPDDQTRIETNLTNLRNQIKNWNTILVSMRDLNKLFVDKKESDELNCATIEHKIYFGFNSQSESDAISVRDTAVKLANDICAFLSLEKNSSLKKEKKQ